MVKLKQVIRPYIELIQEKNTTIQEKNRHHVLNYTLISTFTYYLNTIIKSYWIKLRQREFFNHDKYVEDENYYNVDGDYSDDDDN